MEAFGLDELALVRSGIANGLRTDLRKNGEARRANVVHTDIAQRKRLFYCLYYGIWF
ncbi:hypothetical protein GPK93_07g12660 [Encephalitozoon intestinalis]|nr:hypothetical protein GPK93_07g12660 [Encephalitozoon intestinalis]